MDLIVSTVLGSGITVRPKLDLLLVLSSGGFESGQRRKLALLKQLVY